MFLVHQKIQNYIVCAKITTTSGLPGGPRRAVTIKQSRVRRPDPVSAAEPKNTGSEGVWQFHLAD